MGKHVQGIIMYTPDGYMSAQLQTPGQNPFKENDVNGGDEKELRDAGKHYLASTGPFFVEHGEDGREILKHHMKNCSLPNWLGDTQVRVATMGEEDGERFLTLRPDGASLIMGEIRIAELRWRRVKDNSGSAVPVK
jgi:hypothetical protein